MGSATSSIGLFITAESDRCQRNLAVGIIYVLSVEDL